MAGNPWGWLLGTPTVQPWSYINYDDGTIEAVPTSVPALDTPNNAGSAAVSSPSQSANSPNQSLLSGVRSGAARGNAIAPGSAGADAGAIGGAFHQILGLGGLNGALNGAFNGQGAIPGLLGPNLTKWLGLGPSASAAPALARVQNLTSTGVLNGASPLWAPDVAADAAASFAVPAAADAGAAGAADIMPAMTNIAGASSLAAAAPAATAATSSLPAWLLAALPALA